MWRSLKALAERYLYRTPQLFSYWSSGAVLKVHLGNSVDEHSKTANGFNKNTVKQPKYMYVISIIYV